MNPICKASFLALCCVVTLSPRAQLHYTLSYTDSSAALVRVTIEPAVPLRTPVVFIMPRSVPGNYGVTKYDAFIEQLSADGVDSSKAAFIKNSYGAPRWECGDSNFQVRRISYVVNLKKMDEQLHAASDKSIIRPGFAGLLNYSVLGWIEGHAGDAVTCSIKSFASWPIFSTLCPSETPAKGTLDFAATDYYALADAQTYLGKRFRVREYPGLVPLFVADYSEGPAGYMDDYAWEETTSMKILKDYFGHLPFPYYTLLLRETIPLPGDDPGNFGMEHLQSSTFFGDTSAIHTRKADEKELWQRMPGYLHHMAHAYIPLRCYGDTYRPYVLEIPPVIHNIWFNEGFMWYIVYDTLKQQDWLRYFQLVAYKGPPEIRAMTLTQLSETASTQYAEDFRLGTAVFSRGALMAAEINDYLLQHSGGRFSMRTVYRYLYEWSERNRRPFTMEEFPHLLHDATGLDVSEIIQKWQGPPGDR